MSVTYRLATIDDLDRLYELEQECFKEPYKRSDLEYELISNPINKFVVAISDNEIIGFIDFMITFNSATINQVAVEPRYRKQGIGTSLLNEMEKYFPKDGDEIVENVTLEVRESNIAGLSLYKKDNYEKITIKPHYYSDGEDAIYMVKRLLLWR